ncbi:MAG: site-specific integrase, partial [Solirubrobacteraceae bacterium]
MSAPLARAPQTFEQLALEFLTDLEHERCLARNTIDAYRSDLVQFGAFLAHQGRDALAVEHAELAAFIEELANTPAGTTTLAAATLQRKIACLTVGPLSRCDSGERTAQRFASRGHHVLARLSRGDRQQRHREVGPVTGRQPRGNLSRVIAERRPNVVDHMAV